MGLWYFHKYCLWAFDGKSVPLYYLLRIGAATSCPGRPRFGQPHSAERLTLIRVCRSRTTYPPCRPTSLRGFQSHFRPTAGPSWPPPTGNKKKPAGEGGPIQAGYNNTQKICFGAGNLCVDADASTGLLSSIPIRSRGTQVHFTVAPESRVG